MTHPENARFTPMTERLADALRKGNSDAFSAEAPAAACLFPLLNALGWHGFDRALVEALPHFTDWGFRLPAAFFRRARSSRDVGMVRAR